MDNNNLTFGKYLQLLRIQRGISMRQLAKQLNMDIGNFSKIENSKMKPPAKEQFLNNIEEILKLTAEEKETLINLSSHEIGEYPRDIKSELKEINNIPVLLRAISRKKLTDEHIKVLTEIINNYE